MQQPDRQLSLRRVVFLTGVDKSSLLEQLAAKEQVVGVVLPFKSDREERLAPVIKIAERQKAPVFRPKRVELARQIASLAPDILVSAGYPYLLTPADLSVARVNLNIHPSLLPKYRGKMSGWFIIANGETETGATVHFMSPEMDKGNIIAQQSFALSPFDTLASVARKTAALEPALLFEALDRLRRGEPGLAQDENQQTTYLETRTPEDSRIDPRKSLVESYDFIRACDPQRFPAFFEIAGQRVGIKLFRLEKPAGEEDML